MPKRNLAALTWPAPPIPAAKLLLAPEPPDPPDVPEVPEPDPELDPELELDPDDPEEEEAPDPFEFVLEDPEPRDAAQPLK